MPASLPPASTIPVIPRPFCVISSNASLRLAVSSTQGILSLPCIMSSTCNNKRRPSEPPGCDSAKSSAVNPRCSSSDTASASPITSAAVVLEVGASPNGHASFSTLTSRCASAASARVESTFPVSATSGAPRRLISGRMVRISVVSPELDNASTTSLLVIMPMSP